MDLPSGFKLINPDSETERVIADRQDPPWREWAVRHPNGKVTVQIDGHAFPACPAAETERITCEQDCDSCDGGPHTLVCRDRQPWRAP